ncbi:hypothetical protein [Arthrobacter pascens]|uniref:hypothetical protein n=1 Tax=Arthrobacter pascens TaxID=1677 RepID=UPI00196BB129|nr:hypothetical protein [Arthrobacter pascens]MBN3496428.1 hypothetical protein [Arthrobacter pascens]
MIKFLGRSVWNGFGKGHGVVIVPVPGDKNSVRFCVPGQLLELPDGFFKLFFKAAPGGGLDFAFRESRHYGLSFGSFGSWLSRQLAGRHEAYGRDADGASLSGKTGEHRAGHSSHYL